MLHQHCRDNCSKQLEAYAKCLAVCKPEAVVCHLGETAEAIQTSHSSSDFSSRSSTFMRRRRLRWWSIAESSTTWKVSATPNKPKKVTNIADWFISVSIFWHVVRSSRMQTSPGSSSSMLSREADSSPLRKLKDLKVRLRPLRTSRQMEASPSA